MDFRCSQQVCSIHFDSDHDKSACDPYVGKGMDSRKFVLQVKLPVVALSWQCTKPKYVNCILTLPSLSKGFCLPFERLPLIASALAYLNWQWHMMPGFLPCVRQRLPAAPSAASAYLSKPLLPSQLYPETAVKLLPHNGSAVTMLQTIPRKWREFLHILPSEFLLFGNCMSWRQHDWRTNGCDLLGCQVVSRSDTWDQEPK